MSEGKHLRLRAVLEGFEVPCVSAFVTAAANTAAVAAIQIVSMTAGLYIAPRSKIELFYYDTDSLAPKAFEGIEAFPLISQEPISSGGSYRLLLSGTVSGFGYRKNIGQNSLVLHCVDDSGLWDITTNQTAGTTSGVGGSDEFTSAMTLGASATKGWVTKIKTIMDEGASGVGVAKDFSGVSGAIGAMINLLLSAGGIYPPAINEGTAPRLGNNLWSSYEELRLHLSMQLGADDGTSAESVFAWSKLKKALFGSGGGVANGKQRVSFRDIANHICQQIFYNISPQPCPYYRHYEGTGIESSSFPMSNFEHPSLAPIYTQLSYTYRQIASASLNYGYSGVINNIMAASIVDMPITYHSMEAGTVIKILQSLHNSIPGFIVLLDNADDVNDGTKATVKKYLDELKGYLTVILAEQDSAPDINLLKTAGATAPYEKLFKTDINTKILKVVEKLLTEASFTNLEELTEVNSKGRLLTQIVLPDIWMASPPTCNIIFPDEYDSFEMARDFTTEATKVIVTMSSAGGSGGDEFVSAISLGGGSGSASEMKVGTTQDWEKFSGPIIYRVAVPSMFGIEGASTKEYGQMVANYMFYHMRYGTRSAAITCGFLPRILVGVPAGIILSRIPSVMPWAGTGLKQFANVTEAVAGLMEEGLNVPSQVLGMVVSLSHMINQSTAKTSIDLGHVRSNHPDDEFLADSFKEEKVKRKVTTIITYTEAIVDWKAGDSTKIDILRAATPTDIAQLLDYHYKAQDYVGFYKDDSFVPDEGSASLEEAKKSLDEILKGYMSPAVGDFKSTQSSIQALGDAISIKGEASIPTVGWLIDDPAQYLKKGPKGGEPFQILVPFSEPPIYKDPGGGTLSGGYGNYLFEKIIITEEVEQVLLIAEGGMPEDKLMPEWLDSNYKNNAIGEIYKQLFGCQSITSEGVLGATSGPSTPTGVPGSQEGALDALSFYYDRVCRTSPKAIREFIRTYTYRPIATMGDVLGQNTFINPETGMVENSTVGTGMYSDVTGAELEGSSKVGFHQGSFGSGLPKLSGLLGPSGSGLEGASLRTYHSSAQKAQIPPELDVRTDRASRVQNMVLELRSFARGLVD